MARYPTVSRVLQIALFEDWMLKFICAALAALMWFYIDGELTSQVDIPIALRAGEITLPNNLELATDQPLPKFVVRVRGPRNRLQLATAENVSIKPKQLESAVPGKNEITLLPADVEVPEGFDIVSVFPRDATQSSVEVMQVISTSKPVRARIHGEPRIGHIAGRPHCDPPNALIEGEADLEHIEYVWTEDIDITDADQDLLREVGIVQAVDVGGKRIPFRSNQRVRVIVPIRAPETKRKMTFEVHLNPPEGMAMQVEPKTVEVEVVGDERDVSGTEIAANIMLYVEWPNSVDRPKDAGQVSGPHPAPLRWVAPPHVQITGLEGNPLPTVQVKGVATAMKAAQ